MSTHILIYIYLRVTVFDTNYNFRPNMYCTAIQSITTLNSIV